IKHVITEVLNSIEPLANKNNDVLEIALDSELGLMDSDQTMIRQILFNLLSNAVKFTENGVIVFSAKNVTADDAFGMLEISVKDNGIGIDKSHLERIFSAFEQVDGSYTRQFDGTGLGLALVKHYCDLLSGNVEVESVLGEGTTFIVTIPLIHQVSSDI
ncbi:MAG: ATP-binding protein, partial [Gammaproteobacteria bacterium]|nr:ATP-binding protein [Gammaproteobacteria bacterium]